MHHHHEHAPAPKAHAHHDHSAMMSDPGMAKQMERDMARRFWIALALTIPIVVITGHMPGLPMLVHPPLSSWIALVLSTPVVFWCGSIFLTGSVQALRTRKLDMSVLIATGVLAAYLSSVYLTIIGYPTAYFEAAAMLVTFVSVRSLDGDEVAPRNVGCAACAVRSRSTDCTCDSSTARSR